MEDVNQHTSLPNYKNLASYDYLKFQHVERNFINPMRWKGGGEKGVAHTHEFSVVLSTQP